METISAAYAGGVLALACLTSWVILYLNAKYGLKEREDREFAWVAYLIIWLMAVMLFTAKVIGF